MAERSGDTAFRQLPLLLKRHGASLPAEVQIIPAALRHSGGTARFAPAGFYFNCAAVSAKVTGVTFETFRKEITAAVKSYDKFVVCLEKSPEEFEAVLRSLMQQAIEVYEGRGAGMRHGIALDKQVTIILSQNDGPRPLCGIYFNLHSPYQKNASPKTVKAIAENPAGPMAEEKD